MSDRKQTFIRMAFSKQEWEFLSNNKEFQALYESAKTTDDYKGVIKAGVRIALQQGVAPEKGMWRKKE